MTSSRSATSSGSTARSRSTGPAARSGAAGGSSLTARSRSGSLRAEWSRRRSTSSTTDPSRTARTSSRWSARRCSSSRGCAACAPQPCSACRMRSPAGGGALMETSWRRSACGSARPRGRPLLADREPLLRARHRLVGRGKRLAQCGDVARDLLDALEHLLVLAVPGGRRGEPLHALLDAVEGVLDRLEPLRDRAHAAGEALDVGGGRDVQRAHRDVLGGDRLLTRLEGALEGAGHDRVARELLGELPERFFPLSLQALLDPWVLALVHPAQHTVRVRIRLKRVESVPQLKG